LPTYIRHFNGAFFYFLQNIVNEKHQLLLKYDWYDPNVKVKKQQIGKPGTNLTPADIKFATTGIGYIYSLNKQTRLILSYSMVSNENTALPGFTSQLNDNVFTCRLHFIF
jgi:outer membrane receptor for monomeric catechols